MKLFCDECFGYTIWINKNGCEISAEKDVYTGRYEVLMQFDKKTAVFWQRFTAENVNSRIGIMLGKDRLLCTPRILYKITDGASIISGLSEEDCHAIANFLNGE